MRRKKGVEARRSWASPKVGEERGGKGMQLTFLPGRFGFVGLGVELDGGDVVVSGK